MKNVIIDMSGHPFKLFGQLIGLSKGNMLMITVMYEGSQVVVYRSESEVTIV